MCKMKLYSLPQFSNKLQNLSFAETRRVSFKTMQFGTFTFMQDIHINMPFQSWEIRPKGLNNCLLTLIAAIVELEIEVKVRFNTSYAMSDTSV